MDSLDISYNHKQRLVKYKHKIKIYGCTGSESSGYSFGELSARLREDIVVSKTLDPNAVITDDHITIFGNVRIDKDLKPSKRGYLSSSHRLSDIKDLLDYLREIWFSKYDRSLPFDNSAFLEQIESIRLPDITDQLHMNMEFSRLIAGYEKYPIKNIIIDGKNESQESFSLMDYVSGLKGKNSPGTLFHIPMLLVERGETEIPIIKETPVPEAYIAQHMIGLSFDKGKDYDTLEMISKINNSTQRMKKSVREAGEDLIHVKHLTMEQKVQLADRGVFGKEMHLFKTDREKSLSHDANLEPLEDYLELPLEFNCVADEKDKLLLSSSIDGGLEFVEDHVNGLSRVELYEPLRFLDRVLSEVVINNKRNPSRTSEFIVKKIHGYRAFIIIKNTRLGNTNDPAPSFYSIIFKGGQYGPRGLFEEAIELNDGWHITRFVSTDRTRSSHTMNLWEQFSVLCWENLETLGMLTETFSEEQIVSKSSSIKHDLISMLHDSTEYSAAISNLRFYYFPLMSGFRGCKSDAEKIVKKFPGIIRSPLLLHDLRKLAIIHENLDEDYLVMESRNLMPRKIAERLVYERDEDDQEQIVEDLESDTLPSIQTPFGYTITNTRSFLKASYNQIYHNKDEADKGSSSKQIVSKIFKTEKRMRDTLKEGLSVISHDSTMNELRDIYSCNLSAIIHGADLIMDDIISEKCPELKNDLMSNRILYDEWIMKTVIMPTIIRTTYSELATTKATFINKGNVSVRKLREGSITPDDLDLGETKKCIEVVYKYINEFNVLSHGPAGDIGYLMSEFDQSDGGRIVAKIFKKNQNTGVRDIYILTIHGRMLVRVCEDISRSLCKCLPNEKLTSSHDKERFMVDHYMKVKQYTRDNKLSSDNLVTHTFKESGDMSEWANRWFMKSLSSTLLRLIPIELHPLVMKVMNSVTDKHIELPKQFVKSAFNNPDTILITEASEKIKRELIGRDADREYLVDNGTRVTCYANMMQGILHYTSSLAHTGSIRLFCKLMGEFIKKATDDKCHVIMSYECSSDDKGILMTLLADEDDMPKIDIVRRAWAKVSSRVDESYGIKTSKEKTNFTVTSLFEFNNIFYCGNSIAVPISKFTSRCIDDSVQSSLHQRVSHMYSSARQVRESGGSGILCSLITYAQRSALMNNIGWRSMNWFTSDVLDMLSKYKFSFLGYRHVCGPITAGICMSEYENMKQAMRNNTGAQLKALSISEFSDEEFISKDSMDFGIWERTRHFALLKTLGLTVKSDTTPDDVRIKLTGGLNKHEMKIFMEQTMRSKGFGRSLAHVQRSDILGSSVYLLWSQTFNIQDCRNSIKRVISALDSNEKESMDCPNEYKRWMSLEEEKRSYVMRSKRSRLRPRKYDPLIRVGFSRDDLTRILKKDWYGLDIMEQDNDDKTRSEMYSMEWLMPTPEETFKVIEPSHFLILVNEVPSKFKNLRLLARGPSHSGDTVETLMRENCCSDMIMRLEPSAEDETSDYFYDTKILQLISHRIYGWAKILGPSSSEYLRKRCFSDIERHSSAYRLIEPILSGTLEDNRISLCTCDMMGEGIDLVKLFYQNNRQQMTIKHPNMSVRWDRRISVRMKLWKRSLILIHIRQGKPFMVTCKDYEVAKEFSSIHDDCDISVDFPSLIIRPDRIIPRMSGIVLSDGEWDTPELIGTSRSNLSDIIEPLDVLDEFVSASNKEISVEQLSAENNVNDSILMAIWDFHKRSTIQCYDPTSNLNLEEGVKGKNEIEGGTNIEVSHQEYEEMMLAWLAEPTTRTDEDCADFMGDGLGLTQDGFAFDILDFSLAGSESIRLRTDTGWDRNKGVSKLVSIFGSISRIGRSRNFIFSRDFLRLYERAEILSRDRDMAMREKERVRDEWLAGNR